LEEKLIADYADDSDLIGQKKAQKTQRKISHREHRKHRVF
jgi:hypothetical protein